MLRGYEPENLFTFSYTTTSKKLWHLTILVNWFYGIVIFVYYVTRPFEVFLKRIDPPTVYIYVVYDMFIVLGWLGVGFKLRTLVQSYSRQASNMVLRLNTVMLIVLITNFGRCMMLIWEIKIHRLPVGYLVYTIFIKYLPFFVGNLVLIRLMSWSNDNEASYEALSTSGEDKEDIMDEHANRLDSVILNENGNRF